MTVAAGFNDRVAGTLVGHALGDALGAGYEFGSPAPAKSSMRAGGLGNWKRGEWTDDTQMAICIAEVTATGSSNPDAIGDRFIAWYREGQKDVGIQTSRVLSAATFGSDLPAIAADYFADHPHGAAGNGSLMRTAPVALAHLGNDQDLAESARAVSYLTHADPLAGDACVLWCVAIDRAVRELRLDGVWDGLDLLPTKSRDRWRAWLKEAEEGPPDAFNPNGFVVPALQAAHSAIVHTPVPHECPALHLVRSLWRAVRIGNDTDTVAAIAGGLLGAYWGATAVPIRAKAELHGWPGYRARDLVRLAVLTASGGAVDNLGWPSAECLVTTYEERGEASGRWAQLSADPNVIVGDVAALTRWRDETDVVLSLCRVGTADVAAERSNEVMLMDFPGPEDNPNLDLVLVDAARSIGAWVREGKKVFIHCVGANSRTPTVAAAYLAECHGRSGSEALREVRRDLPGAWHNRGFADALERLWPDPGSTATFAIPDL